MATKQELLKNHVLYGLDRAILDYLGPILGRELGKPFQDYRGKRAAQDKRMEDETYRRGATLAGRPIREVVQLQEQLLPAPEINPTINRAWAALMATARGEWRELCMLYDRTLAELCDLERMAVAQQAAEEGSDADHAALVKNVLDLDNAVAPAWWRGDL